LKRNSEVFSYQLKKEKHKRIGFFILFCISLYIFINLVITYLIYPVLQNSSSMIPDIPEKSLVMVSPLSNNLERGDVVLLKPRSPSDAGFLKKQADRFVRFFTAQKISILEKNDLPATREHIRRVVGMPGDTIYMRDYVLYVKAAGEKHFLTEFEIIEKPYNVTFFVPPADWDTELGVKGSFEEIKLGPDEYFVLADNRKSSDDSRLWGTVHNKDVSAKLLMCYFPFKNFKLF